jgi:hypothetical protein
MASVHLYVFWKYLNQPLFHPEHPALLNLSQFWQRQQMALLTRCWHLETAEDNLLFEHHPNLSRLDQIIRLERCWNWSSRAHHSSICEN